MPPLQSGLPERSEVDICEAIQACAKLCLVHSDPQRHARECVVKLIQQGWSASDASEVLTGVQGVIARLSRAYLLCHFQFPRRESRQRAG